MTPSMHANDAGAPPPRMEIFQATWAMIDLPSARQRFDLEEAVDWIAGQEFEGVMHSANSGADFAAADVIRKAGLKPAIGFQAGEMSLTAEIIKAACDTGVSFLNAQVLDAYLSDAEAVAKLERLYELADLAGVPLFIETHRGTITQDLLRTVAYASQVPRVRFTLDASHYVVAGEIIDPANSPRFNQLLAGIIARTSCIHARVSNGEQVQVDIGDGSAAVAQPFVGWWTSAYLQWRADAPAGAIFPFVSELGPRPYAIAAPSGEELSDRRAQALVFKRIAETIRSEGGR